VSGETLPVWRGTDRFDPKAMISTDLGVHRQDHWWISCMPTTFLWIWCAICNDWTKRQCCYRALRMTFILPYEGSIDVIPACCGRVMTTLMEGPPKVAYGLAWPSSDAAQQVGAWGRGHPFSPQGILLFGSLRMAEG
jgi:hypothetical protein